MSEGLTSERLAELSRLVEYFEARKKRAAERLAANPPGRWCFGLLGVKLDVPEYRFDVLATLRPVAEPPGEVELATALRNKELMSAIGRYTRGITYELVINRDLESKGQPAFNLAWWIISAIRVRTLTDILVPAVADHSWSTIAAVGNSTCHVQLLEDVPGARRFGETITIKETDLDWVTQNLVSFASLLERPRYRLAVECLTTHSMENSVRMTAASLWAGFEALFGITSELRFRLAALVASYLRPRGQERIEMNRRVKQLYDFRSKVVHGASVKDEALIDHVREARVILSELLCNMAEHSACPEGDEWDTILFA